MPPHSTHPSEIMTTQFYSRRGMGFLWNKRNDLDPNQVKILNSIYNNKKKKTLDGCQTITYRLSSSKIGQLGYGRYYSSIGGLETVEREARGTLCREFYHDIDIVNCHPVLLEQFAELKYNQGLPSLFYYNKHREDILAQISNCREDAKTEIIRIMYGGKNTLQYTAELSESIKDFTQFLINKGDYSDLWDCIKKDDSPNRYGRFLSFILQTEERKCMLAMKEAFEKEGWSVDVLCYDGIMIRIRDGIDYLPSLKKAEEAILEKTGYRVSLSKKEMQFFEVPQLTEEVAKGITLDNYNTMKTEFERKHFYHIPTDQIAELNERGEIFFMKKQHAYNYLTPSWCFRHSEKLEDYTPFLDIWFKDQKRRMVDKIDFAPSDDPQTFVVPFQFAYESETSGEGLDLFMELLKVLTKEKDQEEYLLNYLAHLLQKPLENPKVAIVITGIKGCGKDTLVDFLMDFVVGSLYSTNYSSNDQFFDTHDMGQLNKFLVKLEEADPLICKKNASNLKARITASKTSFNPKGLSPFGAANYIRYIFTTNKGNPFEMSDGERRFFILNANPSKKGDFEFWKTIRSKLFTPSAGRAVAEMLLARNINTWNSFDIPISEYQRAVVESEKNSEQSFVEQWDGEELSATELYTAYRNYCVENSLPHAQNAKSFGLRLLPLLRDGVIVKKRTRDGATYTLV